MQNKRTQVVKMVFSSLEFIFLFLPAFSAIYALSPPKARNLVLFAGSVVFYSFGVLKEPVYIMLFLLTIVVNYIIGRLIQLLPSLGKLFLITGVLFNFLWLIFFKYTGFFAETLSAITGKEFNVRQLLLPIGISFYTFQNVSYITDVYRRETAAEKSLISYGAYISMFPQLIAGPIVRYSSVAGNLIKREHTARHINNGLKTFTIGLGYKVLLANQTGGLWRDIGTIGYVSISTPLAWLGIFAYSFQLYFDFCGYSLMAIGLAELFGFEIPRNFNNPYMSISVTDFWRRWHITLGSWFREYVYIPLGGNRGGTSKTVRNYLIVWLFTGLWHGASWNFVIWGLVIFALIMLERFVIGDFLNKFHLVGHLYIVFVIPLTWLIFAETDFNQLGVYFTRLFPLISKSTAAVLDGDYIKYWNIYGKFLIADVIFSTPLPALIYKKIKGSDFCTIILLIIFWASIYCIYQGLDDPFMYFRF